ncbi:MAG: hypothetical protein ABI742_08175 [Gemmatimonadota bacterium]
MPSSVDTVVSGGTERDTAQIIHRLKAESSAWRQDYAWFERVSDPDSACSPESFWMTMSG